MTGDSVALFLNEELFKYACDSLQEPSTEIKRIESRGKKGEVELGTEANLFLMLKAFVKSKITFSTDYQKIYSVNVLQLFHEFCASSLISQFPDYEEALQIISEGSVSHPRIVRLEGLVSWRSIQDQTDWEGDVVIYDNPKSFNPLAQVKLLFSRPVYSDSVPRAIHGLNCHLLTLWDPQFRHYNGKYLQKCKVIAVLRE